MDYLTTRNKKDCFGCEACVQICPKKAIYMEEDSEGFRYPVINEDICVNCGLCHKVCPAESILKASQGPKYVFGGYHRSLQVRKVSTSGGAFTAIAQVWAEQNANYLIVGAASEGLDVFHYGIGDIKNLPMICKSKYSQSKIGDTYIQVRNALQCGKSVLFSGTPCQVTGLKTFLRGVDTSNLLLVEVICEGVPSPLYVRKLDEYIYQKYGSHIKNIDYRSKGFKNSVSSFKWDFQMMAIELGNGKILKKDRWFNPYWSIWLNHLMSRPSCYGCHFATTERQADITLGDLWGVHLYCPELYGKNGGASLIICNTEKGRQYWEIAQRHFIGHELDFNTVLKYQSPLKKHIDANKRREACMCDLKDANVSYTDICRKWAKKPSIKLLFHKYIWGNRQKMFIWNLKNK